MMTPYAAWKIANKAFVDAGLKAIPSQMLYNYTSGKLNEGKKPLIKFTRETGVDAEDLQRWINSYIAKKKGVVLDEQTIFDMSEAQ